MIQPGLDRIAQLIAHVPTPWRAIHVAGTNGKGSICAYISAMLDVYNKSDYRLATGQPALKHARYTSPHVLRPRDCINIDGKMLSRELFSDVRHELRTLTKKVKPSEFELLTAIAFEAFTQKKVDLAVIEVGMGGRDDATNVLGQNFGQKVPHVYTNPRFSGVIRFDEAADMRPPPLVSAIAKIGLDHQEFLGSTLAEIAANKAGIIKPSAAVVYDLSNAAEVQAVLQQTAADTPGAAIETWKELSVSAPNGAWLDDDAASPPKTANPLWTSAPQHTRRNTSVAFRSTWAALQRLQRVPAPETSIPALTRPALAALHKKMIDAALGVVIPGRQESVAYNPEWFVPLPPPVIHPRRKGERRKPPSNAPVPSRATRTLLLDGAHNAQSALALAETIDRLRATQVSAGLPTKVHWVVAASATKDVTGILDPLLRDGDNLQAVEFATPVEDMPWVKAMPAAQIAAAAETLSGGRQIETRTWKKGNVHSVLLALGKELSADDLLVVTGSLYLVGDVKRLMQQVEKEERISKNSAAQIRKFKSTPAPKEEVKPKIRYHSITQGEKHAEEAAMSRHPPEELPS